MAESKELAKLVFDTSKAESQLKALDKAFKEFGKGNKNILVDQAKTNNKILLETVKTNNKIEVSNVNKNNKIEYEEVRHANKLEEINARKLKSTQNMYDLMKNAANAYLGVQGLMLLKQEASELVQEMSDVEYKMVEIDRVLNESSLDIDKYRDELIQLAYDYGNSFENVSDVTSRLAKAGFDSDEALELTKSTLLALNTAELDATQATEDMIAVMSQWGLMTGDAKQEAEDYAAIIDRVNKVADNFPITSEDLLEALKKTSSAFKLNNVTIDQTIALITTAEIASQRGGKAIGTAMNSIVQQMFTTKRLATMESLGIDLYTDATKSEFKSIMDIFTQLSEKMQQLQNDGKETSVEMKQLQEVFSVFRRNIASGLLSGIAGEDSNYAKVLETSMNSLGYSLQENEKHMKTARAAMNQFNAELLKLKVSIWENGGEDVFRSLIVLGQELTGVIKELVENFGFGETNISLFVEILDVLAKTIKWTKEQLEDVKKILNEFNQKLQDIYDKGGLAAEALKKINEYISESSDFLKNLITPGKLLFNSADFKTALDNLSEGLDKALEKEKQTIKATDDLAESVLDAAMKISESTEEALDGANNSFSSLNATLKNSLEQLDGYADKYKILNSAVTEFNTTGQITSATLQGLINNNLLQYLDLTANKASINKTEFLNLGEALKVQAIQALQSAAADDINKIALGDLSNISDIAKAAIAQFGNNAIVTGNKAVTAAGQIETMAKALQDTHNAAMGNLGKGVSTTTFEKQSNAVIKSYMNYAKQISNLDISSPLYGSKSGSSGGGSAKQATKTFEQESQERVKIFKKEIDDLESLEKSWVNKYKKLELFSTSDLKFITHQRINRYNEYLNQINQLTGISEADRTELIKEYSSKRQEAELEYFDLLKKQLDDQISDLKEANKERIQAIKDEAQAQIDALKKVENENDRIKQKEEYERKRNELIYGHQGIEYWRQRTGRDAQLALQDAEDKLRELDEDWNEKKEGWTLDDQIEEIEKARDAQIKAIEDAQEQQIKGWEAAYNAQVQLYAQTGQIIYDNSVIQAGYLYNAYMDNFVNPLNVRLQQVMSTLGAASSTADNVINKMNTISSGGGSSSSISTALDVHNQRIASGHALKSEINAHSNALSAALTAGLAAGRNAIAKYHGGGMVGSPTEGLAILRPNEVVLTPEWAAGMNKLVKQINEGKFMGSGTTNHIEIDGNLINMDNKINNRQDVDYLTQKIEKVLRDKFNINK